MQGHTGPGADTNQADFQDSEWDAASGQFDPVSSSVLSVTVKPDGSGSATLQGLEDQYTNDMVNSSETWTHS